MTFKGIVYPKLSSHEVLPSRLHWLFWLKHFVNVASSRQIGVLSLPDPWMPTHEQYGGMLSFSSVVFSHLSTLPLCASIGNSLPLCETPQGLCRFENVTRAPIIIVMTRKMCGNSILCELIQIQVKP